MDFPVAKVCELIAAEVESGEIAMYCSQNDSTIHKCVSDFRFQFLKSADLR